MKNVEINGPATILMLIDDIRENGNAESNLKKIEALAQRTLKYIQSLENPSNVQWHEVKI